MYKNINKVLLASSIALGVQTSFAASVKSKCYLMDGAGNVVEGVNVDKRYEIASVSKIMTAYWAIKRLGPSFRYRTKVHITPVDTDIVNVHLEGGHDPYFGREQMQFLFTELKRIGLKRINEFTFDENFVFFPNPRNSLAAQGHFGTEDPTFPRNIHNVKTVMSDLFQGYEATTARAESIENIQLPGRFKIPVNTVDGLESQNFTKSSETQTYVLKSVSLARILKEMNRNSNNHVSNRIFEALGGAESFAQFILEDLGLEEKDIRFLNGSGDRFDYPNGRFAYNEATCSAVIQVVVALKNHLSELNHELADVMAVAGVDAPGERSTTSGLYSSELTEGALIGKTGTVNPSVSLAGMASTEQGNVYFGFIMGTGGTAADWRSGRALIRSAAIDMMSKYGGPVPLLINYKRFISFDKDSALEKEIQVPHAP